MRRLITVLLVLSCQAVFGQHINVSWTTPSAAATIGTTSGVQTSGPVTSNLYRAAATIASGVATCPAAGNSAYALINTLNSTSAVASANTFADAPPVVGGVYCYEVDDIFQAGGSASAFLVSLPIVNIVLGTAAVPTGLTVVAGP